MGFELQAGTETALRKHAAEAFPEEACGLLAINGDGCQRYQPMTNTHPTRTSFGIDPVEFAQRERELRVAGFQIRGFFHSHPHGPAAPSPADTATAWPRHLQLILGRDGELTAWYRPRGEHDLRPVAISSAGSRPARPRR